MTTPNPSARPFIRQRATGPFWYAKWSRNGEPVIRALGRAWVDADGNGGWRRRRGRSPVGALTEAEAAERMLTLVREHDADQTLLERDAEERRRRGVSFRELAADYLCWLEDVKGAKPSTLRDHRCLLAEPGQAYLRGHGSSPGLIMAALGDRPAREVTTREVEELLRTIAATGAAPRTVNKARQLVCAIFNYGMRPSTYALAANPAQHADRRREPDAATLAFYSPEQIEALAKALSTGAHRDPSRPAIGAEERGARARDDAQDAELVRVAAYAGLRRGELVALRWSDVDFAGQKLIVRRALSGEIEVRSTKSRRAREVPLPDQAAAALQRLRLRREFTGPDDYVFANRFGRRLDPSALRRRYERARDAAGLDSLRFHDLRHTYGSLLVAGGIDLPSVKAAMGHARISTTERYLHARPASELAERFTQALAASWVAAAA
ncbi:MAG: tyrosine-type recombinase/integrase [Solirubrobacteraceae bacterium]